MIHVHPVCHISARIRDARAPDILEHMFRWMWVFTDRPLPRFERAAEFWCAVTDTDLSARRGADHEFATFLPRGADACLKLQGVRAGGGAHLDLDVDDVGAATRFAVEEHGARLVHRDGDGLSVLSTPAGQLFCLTQWKGETRRPRAVEHADCSVSRVDQICFDIGPDAFDREIEFWSALTGWPLRQTALPGFEEFQRLAVPDELPMRILLQRLDAPGPAAAHIDIACSDAKRVRAWHEALGARRVADGRGWLVMRDPADGVYCLTSRDPDA